MDGRAAKVRAAARKMANASFGRLYTPLACAGCVPLSGTACGPFSPAGSLVLRDAKRNIFRLGCGRT